MAPSRSSTVAEVKLHDPDDPALGYYVVWETPTAYGARGAGLSRQAADDLAADIRREGPNVWPTLR